MLYKVLSLHHEEENALFFSVQWPSRRLSLVDLICVPLTRLQLTRVLLDETLTVIIQFRHSHQCQLWPSCYDSNFTAHQRHLKLSYCNMA